MTAKETKYRKKKSIFIITEDVFKRFCTGRKKRTATALVLLTVLVISLITNVASNTVPAAAAEVRGVRFDFEEGMATWWNPRYKLTINPFKDIIDQTNAGRLTDRQSKSICDTGFENSTFGGWTPYGNTSLSFDKKTSHKGINSLKVTGRKANWQGVKFDLTGKVETGQEVSLSVWVYQSSGSHQEMKVSVCTDDGNTSYSQVARNSAVPSGKWTQLKGKHKVSYSGTLSKLFVYIEGGSNEAVFDFMIDDAAINISEPEIDIETGIPGLAEVYRDYFPIGVAVPGNSLKDPQQAALIKKHFNSMTAESDMKPEYIQPREGIFNFHSSDKYVQFCKDNNIRLRGHTLIWHQGVPDWFFKDKYGNDVSREVLLSRMKTHIATTIKKYGDSIDCWDVVNEAIADSQPYGLRDTKWRRIIGDDYVEKAFEYARETVEQEGLKVKLFYNDYNSPENSRKTKAIYDLAKGLKDKGLIDGIGYQCHIDITYSPVSSIEDSIKKFIELDLKVEITELDMSIYDNSRDRYTSIPNDLLVKQAYKYSELMEMLKKYKGSITGVTFWGLKDDMSWLNSFPVKRLDAPLLFDKNCKSKLAYWGIVDPAKLP